MNKLKIVNNFGITPTNTFISAGMDYYIPYIATEDQAMVAKLAFGKSYGVSLPQIKFIINIIKENVKEKFNIFYETDDEYLNIVHLYLALQSYELETAKMTPNNNPDEHNEEGIKYFINNYLVFSKDNKPGVKLNTNDTLFINSGIKVNLHKNDAGLYVNKSGMGNKGWDIRACLVDEDYSGYVHLSVAYTKHTHKDSNRTVYCGDKLTQMMIVEVKHYEIEVIGNDEYNDIMSNSQRGDDGFGSSDVKH